MQNNNQSYEESRHGGTAKSKIDLKERVYLYALEIIRFIDDLNKNDFTAQIIAKQLLRSATSIGANIIEAQAGSTKKDFTNFFNHALKSANESKFWLGLLRDSKKADVNKGNKLLQETIELANILGSSILTLKGKR
ncbi:four helix bundle protein [Patescibacteria group bacterium]|nr:four helix bundle protein [Patescibacteria group bacterium]